VNKNAASESMSMNPYNNRRESSRHFSLLSRNITPTKNLGNPAVDFNFLQKNLLNGRGDAKS